MSATTTAPSAPPLMSANTRRIVLRANALFLLIASVLGFLFLDIAGTFFGFGPGRHVFADTPHIAIGFVEAHGLAFIIAIWLWRSAPVRAWHLTGAGVGVLLGTSNLVFWQLFVVTQSLPMGYLTTGLHWTFAVLELIAAASAPASDPRSA